MVRLVWVIAVSLVIALASASGISPGASPVTESASAAGTDPAPSWAVKKWAYSWGHEKKSVYTVYLARAYQSSRGTLTEKQFTRAFTRAADYVAAASSGKLTFRLKASKKSWVRVPHLCKLSNKGNTAAILEKGRVVPRSASYKSATPIGIVYTAGCEGTRGFCPWGFETTQTDEDGLAADLLEYFSTYVVGGGIALRAKVSTNALACATSGTTVPLSARVLADCTTSAYYGARSAIDASAGTGTSAIEKRAWGLLTGPQLARVSRGSRTVTLVANESTASGVKLLELGAPGRAPHLFLEADTVGGRPQLVSSIDQQPKSSTTWLLSRKLDVTVSNLATNPAAATAVVADEDDEGAVETVTDPEAVFDIPDGQSWTSPARFDRGRTMPAFRITAISRTSGSITVRIETDPAA
ncbi:hypothetical protein QT381_14080 [Galbitalea sp. SE-J8]|uniref:hypothetical protein n=1 Tax=Galbitalea sp. SE-J8 TaxID=3054952 RepID=UPI00259C766E|nr:hypothetical protein [Galbitalea sp. SE-J8]MDM4764135.1 hypothetical protein [Galbitalea sp. SE-J8]